MRMSIEWDICNAATEVLRDMRIPMHYSIITDIINRDCISYIWTAEPVTEKQVNRALNRLGEYTFKSLHRHNYPEQRGVWEYVQV